MTFGRFSKRVAEPAEPVWAFKTPAKSVKHAEPSVPLLPPLLFTPLAASSRASDDAWRTLLFAHMPFHLPDQNQATRLLEALSEIEADIPNAEGTDSEAIDSPHGALLERERRLLAHKRLRFMEQAFIILRLDRYANAPANRGWMNMFRSWSRGAAIDAEFELVEPQFNKAFVYFFANDLRNRRPIDDDPIPHPWDVPAAGGDEFEADMGRLKRRALERVQTREKPQRETKSAGSEFWLSLKRRSNVFLDTGTIDPQGFGSAPSGPPLAEGATAKEEPGQPEKQVED